MANEKPNKVIYGGNTLIDLTGDTVTPQTLLAGATAHDASGEPIQGEVSVPTELDDLSDVNASSPASGDVLFRDGTEWINKKITIEVTQAEYNALEAQELVDPTVRYRIKDGILTCAPVDDNDVSEQKTWSSDKIAHGQVIYSDEEQVIGKVLENGVTKPLYSKTYYSTLSSSPTNYLPHGLTNIKRIYDLKGYSKATNNTMIRPLTCSYYGNSDWNSLLYIDSTYFVVEAGASYLSVHSGGECTITVEYTKTTD